MDIHVSDFSNNLKGGNNPNTPSLPKKESAIQMQQGGQESEGNKSISSQNIGQKPIWMCLNQLEQQQCKMETGHNLEKI